jgi:hypothetical protein
MGGGVLGSLLHCGLVGIELPLRDRRKSDVGRLTHADDDRIARGGELNRCPLDREACEFCPVVKTTGPDAD